ncbi:MAG: alpha/beta fold hydrolase [Hyphomonadaceae bacterium]
MPLRWIAAIALIAVLAGGAALYLMRPQDPDTPPADAEPAPAAPNPDNQTTAYPETDIAAGDLHGLYLDAGEAAPIVLIVPGSGPTDRDGNNPSFIRAATYRKLAEALAERGITTVRVDKRGLFSSAAAGDPNAVTVDIYANDYRAWIDQIRSETDAPCIWLMGHSEGAMMVSAAAVGRSDVCGLILVSGAGRRLGDVLREQLRANPANAPLLDQALHAIAELEAGRHVDPATLHPALLGLFHADVQDFLISEFAVDPAALVVKADRPTLVVQGLTDIQTGEQDARLLAAAPKARLALIEGVNHVLKHAPADRAANIATYSDPDLPVAPEIVEAIAGFIAERPSAPARAPAK